MKNVFRISGVILSILSILLIISCKKEKPTPPVLTTTAVTSITQTTGISGGNITNDGGVTVLSRGACWSTNNTPNITDSISNDGAGAGSFVSNIIHLIPGTTYFIRAYATNSSGTGYGMAMSFKTLGDPPTAPIAIAQPATNIDLSSATLNGSVNAKYFSTTVTFEYGTTLTYGNSISASQNPITGITSTLVSANISGLTSGTLYHFRVKAVNSLGTTYSNDLTFTTIILAEHPLLPPYESMLIDFSNFSAKNKSIDQISYQKGPENSNWDYAATVAGVWKLIITTTLNVPITAYRLALNQDPTYLGSNTWQWSYIVGVAGVNYTARLTGQVRTSDVLWKMYITKEGVGGFSDFLWFEGTSKLDGTNGQWIFSQGPQTPVVILQIDWTRTGNLIDKVKYTYIKIDPFKNSYIEYGLTSNTLNAYYTIHYYNGVKFSDVYVEWSSTTHNGHVRSVDYLGDSNWYCWDANKINIICP